MMPEPRTAERYTVDAKCELASHNLTMDGSTGELRGCAGFFGFRTSGFKEF